MTKFPIKAYAASAISFLTIHQEAEAQVVYVDIDPDIVLSEGGQAAELDLDQNGTVDFWFHNNSFTFYSASFSSYRLMQNILVGPEIDANFIAGETGQYGTAYGGVYTRYYPFALEAGVKIDTAMNFYNYGLQVMGLRSIVTYDGINTWACADCNWYGFFVINTIDKYLGIKFSSGELTSSFGWIRCDVKDEGRTLVIKDYAYETTPNYPIIAGDKLHYVEIDSLPAAPVEIYSFNETLYINLKDSAETSITVTNLSGQNIINFKTFKLQNTVDMTTVASGIYIVTAEYQDKFYSTKIMIH